jgi:hypothetical protein
MLGIQRRCSAARGTGEGQRCMSSPGWRRWLSPALAALGVAVVVSSMPRSVVGQSGDSCYVAASAAGPGRPPGPFSFPPNPRCSGCMDAAEHPHHASKPVTAPAAPRPMLVAAGASAWHRRVAARRGPPANSSCPGGGTGRRGSLPKCCPKGRAGANPAPGTTSRGIDSARSAGYPWCALWQRAAAISPLSGAGGCTSGSRRFRERACRP